MELADVPLRRFLNEPLTPYEDDEVTRLIFDSHDALAFARVAHLTVGEFREWLLNESTTGEDLAAVSAGVTPEMAAAVSKIMRVQDLVTAGAKPRVVTRFRDTIGPGGAAFDAAPAQSSDRRSARHRGQRDRRIAVCERRRGDRRESGVGRCRASRDAAAHARSRARVAGDSHADLRAGARDHADGGDAARRAGGPGVSIDRGDRGGQSRVRSESDNARRSRAGGCAN